MSNDGNVYGCCLVFFFNQLTYGLTTNSILSPIRLVGLMASNYMVALSDWNDPVTRKPSEKNLNIDQKEPWLVVQCAHLEKWWSEWKSVGMIPFPISGKSFKIQWFQSPARNSPRQSITKRDPITRLPTKSPNRGSRSLKKITLLQNPSSQQKIPGSVFCAPFKNRHQKRLLKMPTKQVIFAHFAVTPNMSHKIPELKVMLPHVGQFVTMQCTQTGWWLTYPSKKNMSQLGWWNSQLNGKS